MKGSDSPPSRLGDRHHRSDSLPNQAEGAQDAVGRAGLRSHRNLKLVLMGGEAREWRVTGAWFFHSKHYQERESSAQLLPRHIPVGTTQIG